MAVPPIRYDSDASFHVTVVGVGEDLKQLVDDLPDEIEAVGEYADRHDPITGALTPRQREAIRAAVEAGFYSYPREAGIDAGADRLRASSTATELLQKTEAEIMGTISS